MSQSVSLLSYNIALSPDVVLNVFQKYKGTTPLKHTFPLPGIPLRKYVMSYLAAATVLCRNWRAYRGISLCSFSHSVCVCVCTSFFLSCNCKVFYWSLSCWEALKNPSQLTGVLSLSVCLYYSVVMFLSLKCNAKKRKKRLVFLQKSCLPLLKKYDF